MKISGRSWLRCLAIVGKVGAPMIGVSSVLANAGYIRSTGRMDGLLSSIYMAGFLSTAVGLRVRRATGLGWSGRIVSSFSLQV